MILFACLLIVCRETLQCLGRKVDSRFDRSELDVFLVLRDGFGILARQVREYSIVDEQGRKTYILGQPEGISISRRIFQVQFLVNVESKILGGGTVLGVQSVSCLVKVTKQSIMI